MPTATSTVAPVVQDAEIPFEDRIWVATRERNMYDDSDFFGTYWIPCTFEFKEVMIGSTRFAGGHHWVPVTKDESILSMYCDWLAREAAAREATIPREGKSCTLQNARKYKGVGIIQWIGRSAYDSRIQVARVQFGNGATTVDLGRIQLV